MKREFLINIVLLFLINFLVKPLYIFGVDAHIQNLTSTEVYGKYFFYLNFVFLFQFINDPGIQNWNAQYVPKNRSNTAEHLVSLMQIKFLLFLVFCLAAIGFAWMAGYADLKMTLFICVNLALTSLFMILRGAIAGLGYYRADSFFSALDKVFMILILGYLSWLSPWRKNFDIMLLVYGQGLSFLLACTAATIFLIRKTGFVYRSFSFRHMATVLRQSAPYVLILLFMTAYNKLDGVMLGAMLDDNKYQAGVYAAAYRFYDAANMTGYLFAALLLPMYASNLGNLPVLNELKATGLKLTSAIASGIGCITIFYGEPLLKAVYDEYTPDFYLTLRLLMVGYVMVAVAYIFGTLLVSAGKVTNLNKLFAAGLVLNVVLNLLLIQEYQAIGAAFATLVTQVFVMAGQIFLCSRETGVGIRAAEIIRITAYAFTIGAVFYLVREAEPFNWIADVTLCILISVLLSFVYRIISLKEIRSLSSGKQ